jgi:hypothetical protein
MIRELIEMEITLLIKQGFKGDILDKMFKSARYYFRKKSIKEDSKPSILTRESQPEPEPKEKTPKERIPKEWLKQMDVHIIEQIQKNTNPNTNISDTKPYDSFIEYCDQYKEEIYKKIIETEKTNQSKIDINNYVDKLKKVYKNRFYKIKHT